MQSVVRGFLARRMYKAARTQRTDSPWVGTPDAAISAFLESTGICEKDVVLDIGCGDGRVLLAALRERKARVIGVEREEERTAEARRILLSAAASLPDCPAPEVYCMDGTSEAVVPLLRAATCVFLFMLPRHLERIAPVREDACWI